MTEKDLETCDNNIKSQISLIKKRGIELKRLTKKANGFSNFNVENVIDYILNDINLLEKIMLNYADMSS